MKKLWLVLVTLLLVIGLSGTGNAELLSNLLNKGRIVSGDKVFTDWKIQVLLDTADSFGWANVEVSALEDQPMNPGLRFVTNGDFQVDDGDWLDVQISFKVSVLSPGLFINGVSLDLTGTTFDGTGAVAIGEDVGTTEFGTELTAFDPWVDSTLGIDSSSANIIPQSSIWVLKDILLISDDVGNFVGLDSFEQHFSQSAVPEPSTMLLLGVGLVALGGYVRRKK